MESRDLDVIRESVSRLEQVLLRMAEDHRALVGEIHRTNEVLNNVARILAEMYTERFGKALPPHIG